MKMHGAQTVVVKDNVYCGGGIAAASEKLHVFCYSPSRDTWGTLPACDMRYFGLGCLGGKLTTVGGINQANGMVTSEVHEFDEATQSWKPSIQPMPTARHSPAVLSHHSALNVAGGFDSTGHNTSVVEVFVKETSQWHTAEPLPFPWITPSSLLINNRWYLLGGGAEEEIYRNSLFFVVKIFSYRENVRNFFTRILFSRKFTRRKKANYGIPAEQCASVLTDFSRRPSLLTKHQDGRFFPTHHSMDQLQPRLVHLS